MRCQANGYLIRKSFGPNLLCICPPPVSPTAPPAGAAYLLGHLRANGCDDFDFLDLRLGIPDSHSPTWTYTGSFGESYVMDIPDLPLILKLLSNFDSGHPLKINIDPVIRRFCWERGISPRYLERYLGSLDRYIEHSFSQIQQIDFIGFTVWSTNLLATLMACARLKRRRHPPFIIVGGPQLTSSVATGNLAVISRLVDVVILGEGEESLLETYSQFRRTGSVDDNIPGTLKLKETGEPQRLECKLLKLDQIHPPSYREMQIAAYQSDSEARVLPLQFSRGCTDRCSFCSEWAFWGRFRVDTVPHTMEHIRLMKEEYGANFILFVDSLLNGVPKRLTELAESIIDADLDIGWSAFMRAKMDPDTASILARSGCNDVFVGIESFSNKTLKLMRKRRTKADNIAALEAFASAGIGVTLGFVPGFPGDTRSEFMASVEILCDLQEKYPRLIGIQDEPFIVQPGAPIHSRLGEAGLKGIRWDDEYLDIAPQYRSVCEEVLCQVEGENQGLERIGRVSILEGLATEPARAPGVTFLRVHEEELEEHRFEYKHLHGSWHLARKKSPSGHTYALIVDSAENDELEEWEESGGFDNEGSHRARSFLRGLQRLHVLRPSEAGNTLVRPICGQQTRSTRRFIASPYVVARWTGRGSNSQLTVVHIDSCSFQRISNRLGQVVEAIGHKRKTIRQIRSRVGEEAIATDQQALSFVMQLVEEGIIVEC